jgi:hypothetical protein
VSRCAQVVGDEDLVSRIVFHMKGGQTRLDLLVDVVCAHRNW